MHTTDYFNVFISISEDCPVKSGTVPSAKEKKTIAQIQYELLNNNPYVYSSGADAYMSFQTDETVKQLKGFRSSKM